jgi:starch phosphorylase
LNCSILDGWWDEGYNGTNGFAIGGGEERDSNSEIDQLEAELLYDLLENQLIPMFYDRGISRVPTKWVEMMKNSIKTITPQFSSQRMVKDYARNYYFKALENGEKLRQNNAGAVAEYNQWRNLLYSEWNKIAISNIEINNDHDAWLGKIIGVNANIFLGKLKPEDVSVQIYYGTIDPHSNEIIQSQSVDMTITHKDNEYYHYEGTYVCDTVGKQGFTIRVLPKHSMMLRPTDLYICKWAD